VLLVGGHGTGKTELLIRVAQERGFPRRLLSQEISSKMLSMTGRQRALEAERLVGELVTEAGGEVLLLDDIELLFHPALQIDPLRTLQNASRNAIVVAAWPGTYDGTTLIYAEPGHPEHRVYRGPEVILVTAK
jgi:hypothetical protein